MASKPPRIDLAAAMEEDLSNDPVAHHPFRPAPLDVKTPGPGSPATMAPPSAAPQVTQSHVTRSHGDLRPTVTPDNGTRVAPSVSPSVAPVTEPSILPDHATTDAVALATPVPPEQGTPTAQPETVPGTQRRPDNATMLPQPKRYTQPPSRRGVVRVSGYVSKRVAKELKLLSVRHDITIDQIVCEALDLYFKSHGLPAMAFDGKPFGKPEAPPALEEEETEAFG